MTVIFDSLNIILQRIREDMVVRVSNLGLVNDLLISDHGQETFGINLKAISPEELEQIEVEIMNFIRFQFERFKNKPPIYE